MHKIFGGAVALGLSLGSPALAQDCPVLILYRSGDQFRIDTEVVADGSTRRLAAEGVDAAVKAILPIGPGVSGDLVRAAERRDLVLSCDRGRVGSAQRAASGGAARETSPIDLVSYQRYDLRVNVIDHEGRGVAFAVRGGEVAPADGPVFDMFRGAIPMAPGDVSVTLEVREAAVRSAPAYAGRVALSAIGPYAAVPVALPGGGTGRFILDLAAARTVVAQPLLAPDAELQDLIAVEHSPEGTRERRGTVEGAGGAVSAVGQLVHLPWLEIGSLRVQEVTALVLDSAFAVAGEPIDGVLGLDLLRRAGRVRGPMGRPSGPAEVAFGGPPLPGALEFPLVPIRGVLAVEGHIGTLPLHLFLDSGARLSLVPLALAEREGWPTSPVPIDSLRGLDGRLLPAHGVTLPPVRVGEWTAPAAGFVASRVPVLDASGLHGDAAILGQPFWQAVGEVELDFERGLLRIVDGTER